MFHFSAFPNLNVVEWCRLFKHVQKLPKLKEDGHNKNSSSMYLLIYYLMIWMSTKLKYCGGSTLKGASFSLKPIVMHIQGGAHFVSMKVPSTWLYIFILNLKLLFRKMNSTTSEIKFVENGFGIKCLLLNIQ